MKAWEALAIGRHMILPLRGKILTPDGRGCALGMIQVASGQEQMDILGRLKRTQASRPCDCRGCSCECCGKISTANVITHLFDYHVMMVGDWTIERMIDWLRVIEGDAPLTENAEVEECAPELEVAKCP